MDTHTNTDTNNPINHTHTEEDLQVIQDEKILDLLDSLADDFFGDTPSEYLSNKEDLTCIHNIYDDLQDNGYFNEEIIYYYNAIKYLKDNDYLDNTTGRGYGKLSESQRAAAISGFNNQGKAKAPASKAGPGGRKIGSANLTTPFGVSFLHQGAANMETTIRNLRKVSNKTGKKAFDEAILSSVQRQEKGLSQKDKTKTADQAVARYVGTGARVKASGASVT